MFPLLETAAAFAAVMLVTSLFVSAAVQVIQSLLALRPKILGGMLITLARTYRETPGSLPPTFAQQKAFAEAILSHHLLHTAETIDATGDDAAKLAKRVDYLDKDDLVELVKNHFPAEAETEPAIRAVVKDVEKFEAFVAQWFDTIGATASQAFKKRIRHITVGVSCAVVVLFNLDGLHLVGDLYRDQVARDVLVRQADTLRDTASRLGVLEAVGAAAPRDAAIKELVVEMKKTASILDEASPGVGWQGSWIVKRWSAYEAARAERPACAGMGRLAADALFWIAGLLFSCVMLSLGAPFWATMLGGLVNLGNAVQKVKKPGDADAKS